MPLNYDRPPPLAGGLCREPLNDPERPGHVCLLLAGHLADPAMADEHRDGTYAWLDNESWLCSEPVT